MNARNVAVVVLLLAAVACTKETPLTEEPVRPVKAITVAATAGADAVSLPGEIRARDESPLAFRVGGKVIERKVDLGDTVRRGQVLGRIESTDYTLVVDAQVAEVARARTEFTVAEADLTRFKGLREQNFITDAELARQSGVTDSARARLAAAEAALASRSRQVDYTTLVADSDGVITALDFNVAQVVNAGQAVMKLARPGVREVEVYVPEAAREHVKKAKAFEVTLNAAPGTTYSGSLRELAAAADPATRTYTARIAINAPPTTFSLNMSATVRALQNAPARILLPLSAVFTRDGILHAWKVDSVGSVVHAVDVVATETSGNEWIVTSGVVPGDVVVAGGVNLLHENQAVRVLP